MRAVEFLCLGGVEVANSARTTYYVRNLGGIPQLTMGADCFCDAIDDTFDTIATDPAPWYEPTRPESEEFYGFYAHSISLDSPLTRNVTASGRHGSYLSPARLKGRQLEVEGFLLASSMAGMAYGERWLAESLRGNPCADGSCPTDDALILPACPDSEYDEDAYFRTLVNVGTVDGPVFSNTADLPECYVQTGTFLLASSQPYLYHPPTRCLDAEVIGAYLEDSTCSLTTPEWMGDGTFVIDVTATSDLENLVITGRISLDGDCPVSSPGTSVMPTFTYTIPTMSMDDRIVIDGMRRQAYYYDASHKRPSAALSRIDFTGPWIWPDVGPCTTMCVTLQVETGDATATVDTVLREI